MESEVEFVNFKKDYSRRVCADFYQKFWAGTALANGLTLKTPDGKEIMVNPKDIYVTDLGGMNGNCMCGHAIRYEYWLGTVGPIGSSCIKVMTGLDGQDLRAILRGAENVKFEVDLLQQAKDKWGTLTNQLEKDPTLANQIHMLENLFKLPAEARFFLDNNVPMPYSITNKINKAARSNEDISRVLVKYGKEVVDLLSDYKEVSYTIAKIIHPVPLTTYKLMPNNIVDIGNKIMNLKASDKMVDFFKKLMRNATNPRFADALDVIKKLKTFGPRIDDFWAKIVAENYDKGIQYGFSDAQIEFILTKSSTGKPGLAVRFVKFLDGTEQPPEIMANYVPPVEEPVIVPAEQQNVPEEQDNPF